MAPVNEISSELIKTLIHKEPKVIKPEFNTFNENEIWSKMISYKQNKMDKKDKLYKVFDDIYNSSVERSKNPYVTIGYLTTNDDSHVQKVKNTLNMYEKILNQFPDINLEIVLFWVQNFNSSSFIEMFDVKENLQKSLRVFEMSKEMVTKVMNILGTKFIPEYFFRDIEVRLGRGELLVSGSADSYPSPTFFEIIQRKLMGPFTVLRSRRIDALPFEEAFNKYLQKQVSVDSMLTNSNKPYRFWRYYDFCRGAYGDMQGALRTTLFKVNGWIFDKYVWAADTALIWDLIMFKVPFYSVIMKDSMHQVLESRSEDTPKFVIRLGPSRKNMLLCSGIPTKNMNDHIRPNWGISFDFAVKNATNVPIKYGHLVYNIIPIIYSKSNYNVSKVSFRIFYDKNKYYS